MIAATLPNADPFPAAPALPPAAAPAKAPTAAPAKAPAAAPAKAPATAGAASPAKSAPRRAKAAKKAPARVRKAAKRAAPAGKTPAKSAGAAKPAKPKAGKQAPVKKVKAVKAKLIRDSFTMPEPEYELFAAVKKRCLAKGLAVTKSEVLRAAIKGFAAKSDAAVLEGLRALEVLKKGRPPKDRK